MNEITTNKKEKGDLLISYDNNISIIIIKRYENLSRIIITPIVIGAKHRLFLYFYLDLISPILL